MKSLYLIVLLFFLPFLMISQTVSGDLMRWHKTTIDFEGPNTNETATLNPFSDYLLEVTFTNRSSRQSYVVQGFYAACGDAENSSCTSGNVWRVHFTPDDIGEWFWDASFRTGSDVAINGGGSSAGFMDGDDGSFSVAESNKTGKDFRNKDLGRLQYVGEHYLQHTGTNPANPNGPWFLKAGADAPENTLAYEDFDNTPNRGGNRKSWEPHQQDYVASDASEYTWDGGKGSELLGAVKYLSDLGVNAFSFLTFNVDGDDQNVFPHLLKVSVEAYNQIGRVTFEDGNSNQWDNGVHKDRFDVSKLAQWEHIFSYADKKGMYMHFKTMETENCSNMDDNNDFFFNDQGNNPRPIDIEANKTFGRERKLYYRELIARFGHHLALNWNLTEETIMLDELTVETIEYIKSIDPYNNNTVLHTYPGQQNLRYTPLLGDNSELTGASIQMRIGNNNIHNTVKEWVTKSSDAGKKWVVANDEQGGAEIGVDVDGKDDKLVRNEVLWGTLMAGGAGVEYYYGYQTDPSDLTAQSHRSRAGKYADAARALVFFNEYLQDDLIGMLSSNDVTSDTNDFVFSKAGETYVIYRPNGGSTELSLPSGNNNYEVQWYNPRNGSGLTSAVILGNNLVAPDNNDWVALIRLSEPLDPVDIPGIIEAENFIAQSGVQTETTQDTGGGSNIGFIQEGDYVEYLVDVASAGSYEMEFRIASDTSGGNIIIESNENQVGEVTVPGTSGWQNWENVTTTVDLVAGEQRLRLNFEGEANSFLFNLNYIIVEQSNVDDTFDECMPLEVNGVVAVEAENYIRQTRTDQRQWYLQDGSGAPIDDHDESHHATASSGGYLEILPDTRVTEEDPLIVGENFTNTSGEIAVIDYEVMFTNPGTYFVFVRAYSTGAEDNGLHVGVDINDSNNNWPDTGNKMQWCRDKNEWTWESRQRDTGGEGGGACGIDETIYLEIPSPGMHTISFSMREDGFEIDKFVLSQEFNRPEGEGPEVVLTNCDTLSVDSSSSVENNFSMFPNPARDVLNFSEIPTGTTIRIFNMLGALQTELLIDNGQTSIDTSSLTSGFYLINFSNTENGFKDLGTHKLIIE